MIDKVFTGIQLVLDYINSIPGHSWYVAGSLITASGLTFIIVNLVKNHHYKARAEELGKKFIAANLAFWGVVTTGAAFLVTNGTDLAAFAPFAKDYIPTVLVVASAIYRFGGNSAYKAITAKLHAWTDKKPVSVIEQPVAPPAAPTDSNSMFS
jgi:hypothetical protein